VEISRLFTRIFFAQNVCKSSSNMRVLVQRFLWVSFKLWDQTKYIHVKLQRPVDKEMRADTFNSQYKSHKQLIYFDNLNYRIDLFSMKNSVPQANARAIRKKNIWLLKHCYRYRVASWYICLSKIPFCVFFRGSRNGTCRYSLSKMLSYGVLLFIR
jgi:hypothetical protein